MEYTLLSCLFFTVGMVRIAKPVPFTSRVDQILNVKLTKFFEYGKHQLICGSSGAGKTSTLLLMVKLLMDNGETIIWRDDSSMEALSLVEKYKLRIFVPAGCRIYYQHPNIEYVEYDPTKLTPTVFDKLEKGYVHVIEFDLFTMDMTFFIDFWSRFFYEFYKWKNTRPHWPMAFFTDELNDLAPSVRRGYIPRQLQLSSQIFFSLKKFRKERIRLVASTHGYGDIHKPVREAFNFYLLKKMSEGEVPDILWRFTKMVQKLQLDEMVIIDEEHSFNRMHIKEFVKPRKFTVRFSGDLKPTSQKKLEESAAYNQKITLLAQLLHEGFNVPWTKMAELLGYSNPSGLTGLMKRQDLDSIKAKVKIFMSQLETMEETEEEKSLIVD